MSRNRKSNENNKLLPEFNDFVGGVLKNKAVFQRTLKSDLKTAEMLKILRFIIQVYINDAADICFSEIIRMTFTEEFFESMRRYLLGLSSGNVQEKSEVVLCNLRLAVTYFDISVNELPKNAKIYSDFINLLDYVYKSASIVSRNINRQKFDVNSLFIWINELIALLNMKTNHIDRYSDSYLDIPLIPSPVNLYEEKLVIPNRISQAYHSAEEYLDIQFKLLHRDYLSCVCAGMKQYRREVFGAAKQLNPAVRVFRNVIVHSVETNDKNGEGVYFVIQFTPEDERQIKEELIANQKLFMTGQLVYFSTISSFSTFVTAIVLDNSAVIKDKEEKSHRAIRVSVTKESPSLSLKQEYTMIEPTNFFEPYFQVLKTFQFIKPHCFPMKKYIIDLNFDYERPLYLSRVPSYTINKKQVNMCSNDFFDISAWMSQNKMPLNESQLRAFINALTNEFTLIQGPPGTGKTHLVKAIINTLIDNKHRRKSPILLVCSRNSSLDHVLVPLAEMGRKVVRIGGQTKSEILKGCSVANLAPTPARSSDMWTAIRAIKDIKVGMKNGFEDTEMLNLYTEKLNLFIEKFKMLRDVDNAKRILSSGSEIIGATTTGAAKVHHMLTIIKPEVVIIEEAAEVLEAHVVASIPQGCQHVILIGDHKQLQPSPGDHMSSEKYLMNVSLFERLVSCGIKCHTLTEQHRMRPEISALITPLIYENLHNHTSVFKYPDIKGVGKNVFFLDHKFPENEPNELKSHWNTHEADVLLALADYLTKQGYPASVITILAGYSAQVTYLFQAAKKYKSLDDVTISAIDNYQGEENRIILLSLVRSCRQTIGFLKKYNRVNVALSRAKEGLYITGNMATLSAQSQLWKDLRATLEGSSFIGYQLPLKCQLHGNITLVKNRQQINELKSGGCRSSCGMKLPCGRHQCLLSCHPSLSTHNTPCSQTCDRLVCPEHSVTCKLPCHMMCIKCANNVDKPLPCGHIFSVPCHTRNERIACNKPCNRIRCSTHNLRCDLKCCETCIPHMIPLMLLCGHKTTVECHVQLDGIRCLQPCKRVCERGHPCLSLCHEPCPPCDILVERPSCLCFTITTPCYDLD